MTRNKASGSIRGLRQYTTPPPPPPPPPPAPHTAASFPSVRTNHGSIGREKKCFPQCVFGSLIEKQWLAIRHLHISHNSPYLPLKFCISIVLNFSYRTAVKPRRNEKQRLCNISGGGQKRCIVEDVQVAYGQILSLVLCNSPRSLLES